MCNPIDLKPCPSCGNKEIHSDKYIIHTPPFGIDYWKVCHACGVRGPIASLEPDSAIEWNIFPRKTKWHEECLAELETPYIVKDDKGRVLIATKYEDEIWMEDEEWVIMVKSYTEIPE